MHLIGTSLCYQRLTEFRSDYQAYTVRKWQFGVLIGAALLALDCGTGGSFNPWFRCVVGLGLGVSIGALGDAGSTKPAAAAPQAPLRPQDPGRSICGTVQTSSPTSPNQPHTPIPKKILSPAENRNA